MATKRFDDATLAALRTGKILGVRAGSKPHRVIGVWMVVVEGRLFARSWDMKPQGWNQTFAKEPRGIIEINGREIPVRAIRTRSERLKDAIDAAYAAKYNTRASLKYVQGFKRTKRRDTTTEFVPV